MNQHQIIIISSAIENSVYSECLFTSYAFGKLPNTHSDDIIIVSQCELHLLVTGGLVLPT